MKAVHVLVEGSKGSHTLYKYKESAMMLEFEKNLDNPLPFSYGYIPRTHYDAAYLDVVIVSLHPIDLNTIVLIKPIGAIKIKHKIVDYIIVGIPVNDKGFKDVNSINDISKHDLNEIITYLENFKGGKAEKPLNASESNKIINKAFELYERMK